MGKAEDIVLAKEYFNVLQAACDQNYSVGVIRVGGGLDFSSYVPSLEGTATKAKVRSRHCSAYSTPTPSLGAAQFSETVVNIAGDGDQNVNYLPSFHFTMPDCIFNNYESQH